jgi:hypothetical protein
LPEKTLQPQNNNNDNKLFLKIKIKIKIKTKIVFSYEKTSVFNRNSPFPPARKYSFLKTEGEIKFKILFPANLIVAKKLVYIFSNCQKWQTLICNANSIIGFANMTAQKKILYEIFYDNFCWFLFFLPKLGRHKICSTRLKGLEILALQ